MANLNEQWGIVGHTWAVESLEHAIKSGRAAHAFLLTGPHGIGKTTLARALARRLECTTQNNDAPCGVCRACIKVEKNINPDVRVIEGLPTGWNPEKEGYLAPPRKNERERRTLRVDQLKKDLLPWLATAPFESKYKIPILRRFEEANEETANALLKTLEEPPSHAVLILTAQDAGLLLPTIVSRCQVLALRPLGIKDVAHALTARWKVKRDEAELLARLSGGRIGWAVCAAADAKILAARGEALDALNALLREGIAERITRAGELTKESDELPQLFDYWLMWWRDVLLLQSGDGARVTNVDYADVLDAQAEQYSIEQVQRALTATRTAARQLRQNANARLVTEVLTLSLPGLS